MAINQVMDKVKVAEAEQPPPLDISIGIKPNDIEAVPGILEEIKAGVDALATGGNVARQDLLLKARALVHAAETPRETMARHCWEQVRGDWRRSWRRWAELS